jgi:transposase-like protein
MAQRQQDENEGQLLPAQNPTGQSAREAEKEAKRQAAYVQNGGVKCPFCGSTNIEGHSVDIDQGAASQAINCLDCGKEWSDIYRLTGFEET